MDSIPKNKILEFKQDFLEVIRRQYNLDKPGQMEEAISILRDWVQKQNHFKKKDFSERYYETFIIASKGSLESAKTRLDRMCTMRTLLPQYFGNYNVKTDFSELHDVSCTLLLPKQTDDYYRVQVVKLKGDNYRPSIFMDYFKYTIVLSEYLTAHDYLNGLQVILDYTEANLGEIVTKMNPIELRQVMSMYREGYGMRIKAIHIITPSKVVDALVLLLKQVVSSKVAGRIHLHKTIEEIQEHFPKSILPKDYGGEERSLKELQTEWIEALSSEEHMKYIQEMNEAVTDESCRQKYKFNDQYAGVPGTFRVLSVD